MPHLKRRSRSTLRNWFSNSIGWEVDALSVIAVLSNIDDAAQLFPSSHILATLKSHHQRIAKRRLLYLGIALIRLVVARNGEPRRWILAPRGCRPKMTTMGFNYGPVKRKPYAHSIVFRCVERFEELVSSSGWKPTPEWSNAQLVECLVCSAQINHALEPAFSCLTIDSQRSHRPNTPRLKRRNFPIRRYWSIPSSNGLHISPLA